jgi:hypothetical protein
MPAQHPDLQVRVALTVESLGALTSWRHGSRGGVVSCPSLALAERADHVDAIGTFEGYVAAVRCHVGNGLVFDAVPEDESGGARAPIADVNPRGVGHLLACPNEARTVDHMVDRMLPLADGVVTT